MVDQAVKPELPSIEIVNHEPAAPGVETPWGFNGLGEIVYLRTYARDLQGSGRRETWAETIERGIAGVAEIGVGFSNAEEARLRQHMLALRGTISGRALWQLGTPLIQKAGMDSLVNCWFLNITKPADFRWLMDRLMVGGGVGFSVERANVYQFPRVQAARVTHERTTDADFIVPDTRSGWSETIERTVQAHFSGRPFTYSTLLVRPSGAPLKTFGGTASGPTALIEGVEEICRLMCAREGKRLRSVDVLDIANLIGRLVVAGSARRSAQIAIGDPDDALFIKAKRWANGTVPAWRQNSNNTLVVDRFDEIADDASFWRNFDGGSEPYGLFNRRLARSIGRIGERRSDASVDGINPCGESQLANRESCNLATIWLPNIESYEQFVDVSQLLYRIQKHVALLGHPDPETEAIVHKNLRLGQNLTGILQASDEQRSWVAPAYEALRAYDREYSAEIGVPESVRLTVIQPGGTLSILAGQTPGIHGAYARHYIRRVRFGASDPLVEVCRERGYPVVQEIGIDGRVDHSRLIVEFPCKAPEGTPIASEMSAVDQLEWVRWAQTNWSDQAVSCTVTYKDEELSAIREWLSKHYDDSVKSVSFLRYQEHGFVLAPYEPCTPDEYERRLAKIKVLGDQVIRGGSELDTEECATGACPIR